MLYTTMAAPLSLMLTDQGSRQPGNAGGDVPGNVAASGSSDLPGQEHFSRTRPYVYNDNPDIPWPGRWKKLPGVPFIPATPRAPLPRWFFWPASSKNSTPISSARGWVWGGCLTAAATTGYLRFAAGRHYPTDILVGAAMGAFVGYLVPSPA